MASESGYSNQKKLGQSQFKTINQVGSNQFGNPISQKTLFDKTPLAIAITAVADILGVDGQVEFWQITLPLHTASKNDVMRMITGTLLAWEYDILQVIDANNFYILPISDTKPIVAETAKVLGWTTSKSSQEGELVVVLAASPIAYVLDGVDTEVEEDTAVAANNKALPSQLFIYKDGIQYPISIDTGTPANTVGVPVILTGASGPINITAGDLNVQLTDQGANYDATRIGDGTNLLGINATNEAKVHDADVLTSVNSLLGLLPSAIGQQVSAASLSVVLSTEQEVILHNLETQLASISGTSNQTSLATTGINTPLPVNATLVGGSDGTNLVPLKVSALGVQETSVASLPLPSGAATEAKQDTGNTSLSGIGTNTINIPNVITTEGGAQPSHGLVVMGHTGAGVSRHILIDATGRVVTSVTASVLPTGASTLAEQQTQTTAIGSITETAPATDTASSGLNGRLQRIAQRLTSLIALFPTSLGTKTAANSLAVTLSSDQAAIPDAVIAGTITNAQITVGLTAVRATVAGSAPNAARKKLMVKPSENNTGVIYIGSSAVTTSNGISIIGPDRLEFMFDASDYYLRSDTAGQTVQVLEVV